MKRFAIALGLLCFVGDIAPISAAEPTAEGIEFFEKRIRPILVTHCYECHSGEAKKNEGGLSLDSRDGMLKGGDSGTALVPGDTDKSLFIIAVQQTNKDLRMPPEQKLSQGQIADLLKWVKMGAPDPRQSVANQVAVASRPKNTVDPDESRKFWSYQPVKHIRPPAVKDTGWPRTSVDYFVLARLEDRGIAPSPQADKRTLLRRATFDLTGLPPTSAEMDEFQADNSPRAFETVVDRLLASPRYGERWGRHWLDVVRYADTCGNASDYPVPQAYKYRDWVIRAFDRDLPYDQFVREQIAGDLLSSASDTERYERIVATGYLAIARRFGGSRMGEFHLTLEDTIDNLGRTMLGTSLACTRCHDHKFDPFTMSDYYGLYGIFNSTRFPFPGAEAEKLAMDFVPLMPQEEIEALMKPHRAKLAAIDTEIKALEAAAVEAKKLEESPEKALKVDASAKAVADAKKRRTEILNAAPQISTAYAVADAKGANAKLQVRGDPKRMGEEVPRHLPTVLSGETLPAGFAGSGRWQLAEWLVDARNPLTARVMVNRIWQHHYGIGIVPTPNDFGRQGRPPTNPELLDHLAAQFIESGWSIKAMHRLILLSHAWQLVSNETPQQKELDPQNELHGRFARQRLDAESIRDALLFVSGELDEGTTTAPHPFPPQHSWKFTQHNPFVASYDTKRRSIYLMQQRQRKHPYLALFDGADPATSTGMRLSSTTPLQALFMMNDPLAHSAAAKFSQRIMRDAADDSGRLDAAYKIALSRVPDEDEREKSLAFLQAYRERLAARKTPADQREPQTWAAFARALLSSNEFIYVD